MDLLLTETEARVLGALIEKEITTPEYYPLSLNALVNACNQKSSREPVMNLSEKEVLASIDTLKSKKLAWQLTTAYGRVPKFEHNIQNVFLFSRQELAIVDALLLRGAQTMGELRTRTERMYHFSSLDEVGQTLKGLIERVDGPFVIELPRQTGHKDSRFMHLFYGMPDLEKMAEVRRETSFLNAAPASDRVSVLEEEVKQVRIELDELKQAFYDLKKQLE